MCALAWVTGCGVVFSAALSVNDGVNLQPRCECVYKRVCVPHMNCQ